ncbi:Lipase [Actinidia chinensis var. chinensis]|uniref:Lipase n=1 Tax=Actinidia chinensis var. chinensis TaxID=1590841 RepID=A0A2R6RWI5_ACTCC|nr:Lipase [Actinidia chinensis var. chinensis]
MENGTVENCVRSSESVNGGQDVWSCNKSDASSADHLVVMVHGIFGSATDWKFAAEQFVRIIPDKVFVHCSERNVAMLTLDGVDVMGERLAGEVLHVIKQKPRLRRISFVAHSLGGILARYAIGRLFRPPRRENAENALPKSRVLDSKGTIGGLEPMNFITVATPHLGSRGNNQIPCLFGVSALEKAAALIGHWIFRRTGQHLFLADDDDGKPPLLVCIRFIQTPSGILKCWLRSIFSDIVGWRTSSIRRNSELPKWEDYLNDKYPHIVYEEHCKAHDIEQCEPIVMEDDGSDKLEEELVTSLSRVSWEKVDVSFHSSRLRYSAHSVIQVKDHYMHSEGADVIQHIIDHFLV